MTSCLSFTYFHSMNNILLSDLWRAWKEKLEQAEKKKFEETMELQVLHLKWIQVLMQNNGLDPMMSVEGANDCGHSHILLFPVVLPDSGQIYSWSCRTHVGLEAAMEMQSPFQLLLRGQLHWRKREEVNSAVPTTLGISFPGIRGPLGGGERS